MVEYIREGYDELTVEDRYRLNIQVELTRIRLRPYPDPAVGKKPKPDLT